MSHNIAVRLTGYNLSSSLIETFRYSNNGVVVDIDEGSNHYYEPFLKDSVVISQSNKNSSDAVDIVLTNDSSLDGLIDYAFKGYTLDIFISNEDSVLYYSLWTGKIDDLFVKEDIVTIKGQSHFEILDNLINPTTFLGDLVTDEYDGDENLKGKVRPRLIGEVFNIKPVLINPAKLIYGYNWGLDGSFAPSGFISNIRDGGVQLATDPSIEIKDFSTTALMDAETPAPLAGYYYTCKADSTFKLGSKSIYDITLDVEEDYYYSKWIETISIENDLFGHSVHKAHDYAIGGYFESATSYKSANDFLSKDLDMHLWFDNTAALNATVVKDDGASAIVDFVEAGTEFINQNVVVIDKMTRDRYEQPINKVELSYKNNYNVQGLTSLAGSVSDINKELYGSDRLSSSSSKTWPATIYPIDNDIEVETSISREFDANTESDRRLDKYSGTNIYGIDYVTVTTPILRNNNLIILGIVPDGVAQYIDFSSTIITVDSTSITMDSGNADFTGKVKTLLVGDPVTITYSRFGYSQKRAIVYAINLNTRTMMASYTLQVQRVVV